MRVCDKAPAGWYCTRGAGHDGPCAAQPGDTERPPGPEAKALRAVGAELDVLGEAVTSLDASVGALADMSAADHRTVVAKLDTIIAILTDPGEGLVARVCVLEVWRGDHAREHAQ